MIGTKLIIIVRDRTYGISASYNLGAKVAKSTYVVMLHSDSILPSRYELSRLMKPFFEDNLVVATYPIIVHSRSVWLSYTFWQKCLFAQAVGTERPSANGKFDAYKRSVFRQARGFDEVHFAHTMGTEDADMCIRVRKKGKAVQTQARVVHYHGVDLNYSLGDWIARRAFLAISYGRYVQMHGNEIGFEVIVFTIKPFLSLVTIIGLFISPLALLVPFVFSVVYMRRMFMDPATRLDPRIITLPFIVTFLLFYESFLTVYSFLFLKSDRV